MVEGSEVKLDEGNKAMKWESGIDGKSSGLTKLVIPVTACLTIPKYEVWNELDRGKCSSRPGRRLT